MVERISNLLTDYLLKQRSIEEEKHEIYVYGFQVMFEWGISFLTILILAVMLHKLPQTLVFLAVFAMLRRYAGGIHLNHFISCYIASTISILTLVWMADYIRLAPWISFTVSICLLGIIKILAPVESDNRPVEEEERAHFGKTLSKIILILAGIQAAMFALQINDYAVLLCMTYAFMVCILIVGKMKYGSKR